MGIISVFSAFRETIRGGPILSGHCLARLGPWLPGGLAVLHKNIVIYLAEQSREVSLLGYMMRAIFGNRNSSGVTKPIGIITAH